MISTVIMKKALFMIDFDEYPEIENIDITNGYIVFSTGEAKSIVELAKEYNKLIYRKTEY